MKARPKSLSVTSVDYDIHVLITKCPDGGGAAQCLDFDLSVDGDSIAKAMNALGELIRAYLQEGRKRKEKPMRPAPREYWNIWLTSWQRLKRVKLPRPVAFESPGGQIRFEVLAVAA